MDKQRLAIFDLDHTLLPIDSDFEWGRFLCRTGAVDAYYFELCNSEFYKQYQAGTLNPVEYLEFALEALMPFSAEQLAAMHAQYMREVIVPAVQPVALRLVAHHKNDVLLMITATNRFVTEPIAQKLGFTHLIAAQPEFSTDGRITGKLIGKPTSGQGKVDHLEAWLKQRGTSLDSFERSYFYSDSHNDLPLLELVSHPIATNPDPILAAHALARGWPIIKLFTPST